MGLDLPELDDREYEDLLDQAQKLIPAYSDDWTDFNPHDPGITILEILAWLTETHTYQLDQITDEHRKKFLRLIGHRPRPPTPATACIELQPPDGLCPTRLDEGEPLAVTDGVEDTYRFETDQDVVLTEADISQVYTAEDGILSNQTEANGTEDMFFLPFENECAKNSAFYLEFDRNPIEDTDSLTLFVSYHDDNLPDPNPGVDSDEEHQFTPSVDLSWEFYRPDTETIHPMTVTVDETNVLYESGLIELQCGSADTVSRPEWDESAIEALDSDRYWLRCRVQSPGYEIPPQIDSIKTNVLTASHAVSVTNELLDPVGSGRNNRSPTLDNQSYEVENTPVLSASVYVEGNQFREVPDFDASGPDDPHFVLNREQGQVTFGDGIAGRSPGPDATVTADYVYGGGEDGNVSETSSWQFLNGNADVTTPAIAKVDVTQRGPATGGYSGETIEEALRRARRNLRRPYRAVTEEDYQYLAANTPGLRIGRTNVWIDSSESTVIVVPYAPPSIHSPTPSEGFLSSVRNHLGARTLITDRVTVSGPRYVRLEITVVGKIRKKYAKTGYQTAISDAIESYLHPLFGYDGSGWPFGRTLRVAELEQEIDSIDAVDYVSDIQITAHGGKSFDDRVTIDETALFSVENITVDMTTNSEQGG